eukprot:967045-Prymnesium_polylepis.1
MRGGLGVWGIGWGQAEARLRPPVGHFSPRRAHGVDREELKVVLIAKGKAEYWPGIKAAAGGLTVLLHEYAGSRFCSQLSRPPAATTIRT